MIVRESRATLLVACAFWCPATAFAQAAPDRAGSEANGTTKPDGTATQKESPAQNSQSSSDPGTSSGIGVGDIIVTARKQGETLLRAPATISILQPAELERNNITNANQLTGIAPGVLQSPGSSAGGATTFRGLGSGGSTQSVESSVPTYIDGIYLGHNRDYVTPLYDLDHIELIKGTQSTLLGKNTSLGAVSIVTHRPTDNFGIDASYTHSFTINGDRFQGAINTPIAPDLNARFAVLVSNEDGWLRNTFTNRRAQQLRDISGRLSLSYSPGARSNFFFSYQHDDRNARGQNMVVLTDPGGVLTARAIQIGQTNFHVGVAPYQNDSSAPLVGSPQGAGAFDRQKSDRLNFIASVPLGSLTLTSQTAFVKWISPRLVDLDFLAADLFNFADLEKNKVITEEVRIASPTGARFQYLVGGFYYNNNWGLDRNQFANVNTIRFSLTGFSDVTFNEKTETFSGFTSANYELFDGFKLTAGLRYTHEIKTATIVRLGSGTLGGATASAPPIPYTVLPQLTSNPLDGNVGIEFQARPNILLYASYSKGSKSGGYQENPASILAARFTPETSYTAEVGGKFNFGRMGYLTAAIFDTRIKNFQTTVFQLLGNPPVNQATIGNSNVASRGVEGSSVIQLFPGLRVNAELLYEDAKFTKDFLPIAAKGDRVVRAPTWSGKVGADYTNHLTDDLSFNLHPSVEFTSSYLTQYARDRPDAPVAHAHQLLDLRASLGSRSTGWEFAVIGTNLANKIYTVFATAVSAGGTAIGQRAYYGGINRPRTIAVQFSVKL